VGQESGVAFLIGAGDAIGTAPPRLAAGNRKVCIGANCLTCQIDIVIRGPVGGSLCRRPSGLSMRRLGLFVGKVNCCTVARPREGEAVGPNDRASAI
jgi:hypothetical protein